MRDVAFERRVEEESGSEGLESRPVGEREAEEAGFRRDEEQDETLDVQGLREGG
jgi:hypothetical protein